ACYGPEETEFVVSEVRRLHAQGVPHEEMAVLYRVNARSEGYEEAFAEAGIPFQVRAGPFLARQAARQLLRRLEGVDSPFVAASVQAEAERDGLVRSVTQGVG